MNQPQTVIPTTVPAKKSGGCVKGCLITVAIILTILCIGGYFVYRNLGGWTRDLSAKAIEAMSDGMLKDASLPPEEKSKIDVVLRTFTAKIRSGEVSAQQGVNIVEAITKNPIIKNMAVWSGAGVLLEAKIAEDSALSDTDKNAAQTTVAKYLAGVMHQQIPPATSDAISNMFLIADPNKAGSQTIKTNLSDSDLKDILAKMKLAVDSSNVTSKTPPTDIAGELQKIIDQGMQK